MTTTLLSITQRLDFLEARLNNIEKNYYKDAHITFQQMIDSVESIKQDITKVQQ